MPTKNVAIKVKATAAEDSTLADGEFIALASVFNNIDLVGDVVKPGAFTDDLKTWAASGDVIPVYWGHRMDDPSMNIGSVVEATETDEGLQVKAQLDLETPQGAQVYRLLKGRRVNRMSFAYDVVDAGFGEFDGQDVYELRKLKVHEVSVVQVPANPLAVVQEVKSRSRERRKAKLARVKASTTDVQLAALLGQADQSIDDAMATLTSADEAMDEILDYLGLPDTDPDEADEDAEKDGKAATKAGRVLSAKNEGSLRAGLEKIKGGASDVKSVLDAIDSSDDGKASQAQPAAPEEPDGVKGDEPARQVPASLRLRAELGALSAEVM